MSLIIYTSQILYVACENLDSCKSSKDVGKYVGLMHKSKLTFRELFFGYWSGRINCELSTKVSGYAKILVKLRI